MNRNLILYVVAHTQSYYNRRKIFTGKKDSRLTPLGHTEAKALAQKLKSKKIDLAFVSPLTRSRQTARYILSFHGGVKVITDSRIMERDYGDLSGKSKEKLKREDPKNFAIYHRSYDIAPPHGESLKDVEKRVLAFLKEALIQMKKENKNAIIIAHSNSIRPIRRYFEKLSSDEMMKLEGMYNKIYSYSIPVNTK